MQANTRIHTTDSDALLISLYAIFFVYFAVNRGKSYRGRHKYLPWHVLAGITELALYFSNLNCTLLAVVACYVHSITSLSLAKRLPNGYPPHTRPAYQGGNLLRMYQILQAYASQDPVDYHDAIVPIHSFLYARIIIFLFGTMGPSLSFSKNVNSRFVYAEAIFGSALISIGHCTKPSAIVAYLLLVHAVGKISTFAGRRAWEERTKKPPREPGLLIRALRFVGFFEDRLDWADEAMASADKTPQIGNLPMDKLGHQYTRLGFE
ncbi:hypothetical protein BDV32DRAFT_47149 [Aspergillus pseudonomiae]|uniref:Uncharacterized protein n=1 Tax=Aspergillus pseudonomiae TaxID=1506151 RepID=A0A5N7DSZ7_9EURO|nr:uncharacterized protein BDV37DRAFT_267725 [Aspergillus pseudonomiae]KAB8260431.1 hypothetical protein BDV32DRAFT_47149 [Aspergillus pseudonomiae]KAE8409506.1 hypothetical protein BDV37DRAFT_267725 [Aspergillus pseudonomiae]